MFFHVVFYWRKRLRWKAFVPLRPLAARKTPLLLLPNINPSINSIRPFWIQFVLQPNKMQKTFSNILHLLFLHTSILRYFIRWSHLLQVLLLLFIYFSGQNLVSELLYLHEVLVTCTTDTCVVCVYLWIPKIHDVSLFDEFTHESRYGYFFPWSVFV